MGAIPNLAEEADTVHPSIEASSAKSANALRPDPSPVKRFVPNLGNRDYDSSWRDRQRKGPAPLYGGLQSQAPAHQVRPPNLRKTRLVGSHNAETLRPTTNLLLLVSQQELFQLFPI
jgi:hypothetical protein